MLIPQISRRQTMKEEIRLLGMREFVLAGGVTAVLIAIILNFPYHEELLLFLFNKPEYSEVLNYLAILLVSFPFRLLTMTNKGVVQGLGRPKSVVMASFSALLTHILLFIVFYQLAGLPGGLVAMVCAYIVEFLLTKRAAHRVLKQKTVPLIITENC